MLTLNRETLSLTWEGKKRPFFSITLLLINIPTPAKPK